MCFSLEKIKPNCFNFDNTQYSKEVSIMKKRIEKLSKKVELTNKLLK